MLSEKIIACTRLHFPSYAEGNIDIHPLEKGGSGRQFHRLKSASGDSLIVVHYTAERQENSRYVDIASFLNEAGVRVPVIYRHEPEAGLIWMQDLGDTDLWAFRDEPWEIRRPLYEDTLREVQHLHGTASARFEDARIALEKEFNEDLYLWEQHYFFENCLGGIFGITEEAIQGNAAFANFSEIAHGLATEPRVLVHRDFQSQNILVLNQNAHLIDFQGMRPGLAQYDVASLLYDPYVSLTAEERATLLAYYKSLSGSISEDFDRIFYLCAAQRLMQALGAYGFLGLRKGKREFLRHIPAAMENLKMVAAETAELRPFREFLEAFSIVRRPDAANSSLVRVECLFQNKDLLS